MRRRDIEQKIQDALGDTPVVLLRGARQTGKTTLVQSLGADGSRRYVTLDDAAALAAARSSPVAFLEGLGARATIDEVQFAPQLFPAMKTVVDSDRSAGRFLLTGSVNVLLLPRLAESLAGRMELLTLWPFSQGELDGVKESFIDRLFARKGDSAQPSLLCSGKDLWSRVMRGGYPEIQQRSALRRRAWFGSYVTTILQRDVREFSNIEDPSSLQRLLELLAARTGSLANFSELSRSLSIPHTTMKRYFRLLEATFLVYNLRAWSNNLGKRLVKSPKLYLGDTGLATSLMGYSAADDISVGSVRGSLLENFVVVELLKQTEWSDTAPQLFHYRTHSGREVDVVLEDPGGAIVGVEVKSSSTVSQSDFAGLRHLRESIGDRFHRGVVLYGGSEQLAFDEDLVASPISSLWAALR